MTRLFISLYLFIAISLVALTAGLEQIFFADAPTLSDAQKAWMTLFSRSHPSQLTTILDEANITYSVIQTSAMAASQSLSEPLASGELVQGMYSGQWQGFIPVNDSQILIASFNQQGTPASPFWLYSSVFFILLGIAIALWIYPLWRDLSKLISATRNLAPDGSIPAPDISDRSPLKGIVVALNTLSNNVISLLKQQRELAGAVTHEFKTPLARLKFALAASTVLTPRQLDAARNDVDELDNLVQEMLDFTRYHTTKPDLHMEDIPLYALCEQRVQMLQTLTRHSVRVQGDTPHLVADGHLLSRALDNVLNNAARHAHSSILVTIEESTDTVVVHVDDDGPGIADSVKETVFDAFFRPDADRARQTGGAGLGLATVKRIMQWHGATCIAADAPLGGARITLSLPSGGFSASSPCE